MASKNMLILGALGLLAVGYILLTGQGQGTIQSSFPAQTPISNARKQELVQTVGGEISNGQVQVGANGVITQGSANYKGKNRLTFEESAYNVLVREGANTPLAVGDNPLELTYDKSIEITGALPSGITYVAPKSANTFIAARAPANKEEANAARASNLRSMIASGAKDPKTLSSSSRKLLGME